MWLALATTAAATPFSPLENPQHSLGDRAIKDLATGKEVTEGDCFRLAFDNGLSLRVATSKDAEPGTVLVAARPRSRKAADSRQSVEPVEQALRRSIERGFTTVVKASYETLRTKAVKGEPARALRLRLGHLSGADEEEVVLMAAEARGRAQFPRPRHARASLSSTGAGG